MGDRPTISSWMKLNVGDHIVERDRDDPYGRHGRHIGRIEQIQHGAFAIVRWCDSSWVSVVPIGDLIKIKKDEANES